MRVVIAGTYFRGFVGLGCVVLSTSGQESIVVKIDLAKYRYVDLPIDEARKFIEYIRSVYGNIRDVEEALRYIENFDEFYNFMKKKFKEFIAIPHRPDDYIKSRVVIDKVRLYRDEEGNERVVFVLDRSVKREFIEEGLKRLGYTRVVFEKLF